MFTHDYIFLCNLVFNKKPVLVKLATFFISSTKRLFTKVLAVSKSSIKIKVRLHWTLIIILLTSAVICKERTFAQKQDCAISSKLRML